LKVRFFVNLLRLFSDRGTIVAELFFNHSSTETFRDKLLKLVLADGSHLSASDGQEPKKTEILR
jgi:hypothetical protein